jgi:hypothetical protein
MKKKETAHSGMSGAEAKGKSKVRVEGFDSAVKPPPPATDGFIKLSEADLQAFRSLLEREERAKGEMIRITLEYYEAMSSLRAATRAREDFCSKMETDHNIPKDRSWIVNFDKGGIE